MRQLDTSNIQGKLIIITTLVNLLLLWKLFLDAFFTSHFQSVFSAISTSVTRSQASKFLKFMILPIYLCILQQDHRAQSILMERIQLIKHLNFQQCKILQKSQQKFKMLQMILINIIVIFAKVQRSPSLPQHQSSSSSRKILEYIRAVLAKRRHQLLLKIR